MSQWNNEAPRFNFALRMTRASSRNFSKFYQTVKLSAENLHLLHADSNWEQCYFIHVYHSDVHNYTFNSCTLHLIYSQHSRSSGTFQHLRTFMTWFLCFDDQVLHTFMDKWLQGIMWLGRFSQSIPVNKGHRIDLLKNLPSCKLSTLHERGYQAPQPPFPLQSVVLAHVYVHVHNTTTWQATGSRAVI